VGKQNKSALNEQEGVSQNEITNTSSIEFIKQKRKTQPSSDDLVAHILQGDITALSRSITLVESKNPSHLEKANTIIKACLPHANNSIRIGITGVPGVGKSTFIETFGDKTRMEYLVKNDRAYIRPSASGNSLGGVARKTRETIMLCEAAGFDTIIIETVGVGQSETAVHSMVDFFLLLKLAGAGDGLQGIKRGIMEMADAIAINKADGDNIKKAKLAKVEFGSALHLYPEKSSSWQPKVSICSALHNEGVSEVWELIESYQKLTKVNAYFEHKRKEQNKFWLMQTIEDRLKSDFFTNKKIKEALQYQLQLIERNETTPFAAADYLLGL
jgi:LAO/AO transport system kinase